MIITADNLVARLEKIRPELSKHIGRAPNRMRCNAATYSKLCDDAQAFFGKPEKLHVKSLFGATVQVIGDLDVPDGVVLFDYTDDMPSA
jgi:hypothetical protein